MNRKVGVALLIIGLGILGYSQTLNGYTDRQEFENQVNELMNSENKSEEFHQLRIEYLTPKYSLENYSIILITIGFAILIILPKNGFNIKVPKNKWLIVIIGLLATLITVGGYVGDLLLEMHRYRYPPWADSVGIPMMAVPLLFVTFLVWFLLNLIGLKEPFKTNSNLSEFDFSKVNYWYLFLALVTFFITIYLIYEGDFWWTAAGVAWMYFYVSILIGRMNGKNNANTV
ncbi:hypothetical protein [Fulvivirga lutea]|uniref:Uncharacterized protein n=1 Tax=Fulvivirga lutea TaxID=2810512 RepID=A0A974WID6_9BACT|nr:hypothetical protein [Fulvivirga lutea]QSE99001.1 hypothetical protein JR347_07920 [Fulvivirga lutea]